jgi:tRNA dimethylallyltransferase
MNSTDDSGVAELRVICGPTAAGKSALAMAVAERAGASIISADSRQVHRGFDIGTAKPDADERRRVPHHGIDVVDPAGRYTAADWADAVPGWRAEIRAAGRVPLVVGGTGFYLRALVEPLFDEPDLDADRRFALRRYLASLEAAEVRRWCEALDAPRAAFGRAQWERAIEVALLSGVPISAWHGARRRAPVLTARYLVVDPGAVLQAAIASRVDAMLGAGWVEEVRSLREAIPPSARAWTATGYHVIREVVEGRRDLSSAREEVVVRTRQYAKRQRTWFRHQLAGRQVTQLDPRAPDALDQAMAWFHGEDR